jgi:glyoxylase-like metal-dependent hydrolase (beta-lactamase superfamily II)
VTADLLSRGVAPPRAGAAGRHAVQVLCNGRWQAPGTVIFLHPYGRHDPVEIVQNFFLVRGGGHVVLIDTGVDDLGAFLRPEDRPRFGASRPTVELLAEAGVRPEDVDVLILTHLHFDHYLNARLFPRARIVVNRREFHFALSPDHRRALPRSGFPREVFGWLVDEAWDRLELVDGEADVLAGIRVVETGGHSPGHQIVVVDTAAGPVVIPGDEVYLYANLEEDVPIGYFHDFERVSRAMDLLRELGGHLLPAHDPEVLRRYPSAVIGERETQDLRPTGGD